MTQAVRDGGDETPLHEIAVDELNSRATWEHFITALREVHIAKPRCALNIFGEGQDQYLVVNLYHSDTSSSEFYFSAHGEARRLDALIQGLSTVDYSLPRLIEILRGPTGTDAEGRHYIELGRIKIVKSELSSN